MVTISLKLTDAEFCLLHAAIEQGLGKSQSDVLRNGLVRLVEPCRLSDSLLRRLKEQRKRHPAKKRRCRS